MAKPQSNVEGIHRLTATQEGILFHCIGAPESGVYFQQFTCLLEGLGREQEPWNQDHWEQAWNSVVARHATLRSAFTWKGREHPLQVVLRKVKLPFERHTDPSLVPAGDALEAFLEADRARGFAFEKPPLLRLSLLGPDGGPLRLVWSFHHLLLDGWSMRLVLGQVLEAYAELQAGRPPSDAKAPDFERHIAWLSTRNHDADQAFWRDYLAGLEAPTTLALPSPEPGARGYHEQHVRLDQEATDRLTRTAKACQVTLNTLLRAAWSWVLARHSGSDDVLFGATVSGRPADLAGVEQTVGMFIATVPVRAQLPGTNATIREWLQGLAQDQWKASTHESLPLVDIQRASSLPAGTSLFDTVLVFENHAIEVQRDDLLLLTQQRFVERSHFPLALLVLPGEQLELIWIHDRTRIHDQAMARVRRWMSFALAELARDPARTWGDLPELPEQERTELRDLSRGPHPDERPGTSVLESIRSHADRNPQSAAVVVADGATQRQHQTHEELREAASTLATELERHGIEPKLPIALCLERSPRLVSSILGVLEVGCPYVPLDPEQPRERLAELLDQVDAQVVISQRSLAASFEGTPRKVLWVEDLQAQPSSAPPSQQVEASDLAYILFTSGSTGRPKGVEIQHSSLWQSTAARMSFFEGGPQRFLLLSPYHFDSSVAGLFWTLVHGGCLILPPPGGERDVRSLAACIQAQRVTHLLCLPSLLELLLEASGNFDLSSLDTVMVAGEACHSKVIDLHHERLPQTRLVNEYGPTEATVWATACELRPGMDPAPIGRPIGATRAYVLDPEQRPVPRGVPGELYLGGPGLARGYVGQPEETALRFQRMLTLDGNPERVYATGDLVRWREDGQLDYLGRRDQQVKISGHRIELGEIESRLQEKVHEAVVLAHTDHLGTRLAAYFLGSEQDAAGLRQHLTTCLPRYMVPQRFVALEEWPRTSTGKLDRRSLPDPGEWTDEPKQDRVAPRDEAEAKLLEIWQSVLGREDISVDEDFFLLGGDSLLSIRIIARAQQAGLVVDPVSFADDPTIAGMALAAGLNAATPPASGQPATAPSKAPFPLSPIQRWFFDLDLPRANHWNLARCIALPPETPLDHIQEALQALMVAHPALRLAFPVAGQQRVNPDGRAWFQDLRSSTLDQALMELHTGFDLTSGTLLRAALVPGQDLTLVLGAHHLAVDALSWRTLEDDLLQAIRQQSEGTEITLTPPDAAFAQWVDALRSYAAEPGVLEGAQYWLDANPTHHGELPMDGDRASLRNLVSEEAECVVQWSLEDTEALLHDVPDVYGTRILDLLCSALARALCDWCGQPQVAFDLEGHGREQRVSKLDTSRTVGWFTAVWPVLLEAPEGASGETIKSIKEQLRAVPGGGIDYGALREYSQDEDLRGRLQEQGHPDLLFNYLGRIADSQAPFDERMGCRSEEGERAYWIEINSMVRDDRLEARLSYHPQAHRASTVEVLGRAFHDELVLLIEHCLDPEAGGRTPSDFPLANLDQGQLDHLADLLGDD